MTTIITTQRFALWWKKASEWFSTHFLNLTTKLDNSTQTLQLQNEQTLNTISEIYARIDELIQIVEYLQSEIDAIKKQTDKIQ